MDTNTLKQTVSKSITEFGIANLKLNWSGCGAMWKALEKMANEGATVVLKIDGQRNSPDDNGRYTVIVSGGPLGSEDFFRTDTHLLEEGVS